MGIAKGFPAQLLAEIAAGALASDALFDPWLEARYDEAATRDAWSNTATWKWGSSVIVDGVTKTSKVPPPIEDRPIVFTHRPHGKFRVVFPLAKPFLIPTDPVE